jgi:hypothetical protein
MPVRYNPIVYLPNSDPMPFVRGPKMLSPKTGIPTYASRIVIDASGFGSDYLEDSQDRYIFDQGTPTLGDDGLNGLGTLPRQPYAISSSAEQAQEGQ